MSAQPRHPRRAFRAMQALLIVAILGVTAALSIPRRASALADYPADAAARRVASELAYARSQAIATGQSVTVCLDCSARTLRLGESAVGVDLSGSPYRVTQLATRNSELGTALVVTFSPAGVPDSTASISLSAEGATRIIELDAAGNTTVR